MRKSITTLVIIVLGCLSAGAQDPHFSQYGNLPLYMNPAHAGNSIEHLRFTAVYRNQWSGLASPYTTQGFMADKKVNRFGFGMMVVKNGMGKASVQRLDLSGILAYHYPLGRWSTLSGAMQVGMMNKRFDPDQLLFDNQYVEDTGFDPSLSHGEVFSNTSITRPDMTLGLVYQHGFGNPKARVKPFGGVSMAHINRPDEAFITGDNRMPVRQTWHGGAGIVIKENIEWRPLAVVMLQEHFTEVFAGNMISFLTRNGNKFQAGLYFRNRDAGIAYVGYQVNQLFIGTSYDFTTSTLKTVNQSHGGFELTLSYTPKKRHQGLPTDPEEIIVKKQVKKKPVKIARIEKKEAQGDWLAVTSPDRLEPARTAADLHVEARQPAPAAQKPEAEPVAIYEAKDAPPATSPVKKEAAVTKNVKPQVSEPVHQPEDVSVSPTAETPVRKTEESIARSTVAEPGQIVTDSSPPQTITTPAERMLVAQMVSEPTPETKTADPVEPMPERKAVVSVEEPEVAGPLAVTKPADPVVRMAEQETPAHVKELPVTEPLAVTKPAIANTGTYIDEIPAIKSLIDSDGDGISDAEDECPYIKGERSTRGCPDSDLDGVVDMKDHCPMEPGPVTNRGCPESEPSYASANLIRNFNNIEFETGRAVVKTTDVYDIIEYAIDVLYANPESRIILTGHTDSEGDELQNMILATRRTGVVQRYLERQGINPARIKTVNYGETMPLANNFSDEGRARNRRVEVNIVRK